MYKKSNRIICIGLMFCMTSAMILGGCGQKSDSSGKIEIELVQYKPEAVKTFEKIEEEFNATHDNIHLTIESPNDAMTVLKTRFIREDAPDIIGIGGDVNFSNFIDSDMLMDISDYEGLDSIKQAYLDIDKALEFVPEDGVYYVSSRADQVWIDSKLLIDNSSEVKSISHRDNCVALAKGLHPIKYVFIANITGGWPSWWNGLNLQMRKDNSKEFADVEDSQLFH